MPDSDDEFRVKFMNFLFGASFGDCRVLQFEGKVDVFRGGGVQEFRERFFLAMLVNLLENSKLMMFLLEFLVGSLMVSELLASHC